MLRLRLALGSALVVAGCSSGGSPSSATPTGAITAARTAAPSAAASRPAATPMPTSVPTRRPSRRASARSDRSPLTVSQYMDADPACFAGAEIEIRAWLDRPPDIGFLALLHRTHVADLRARAPRLWSSRPVEPNHLCAPDAPTCNWFFLTSIRRRAWPSTSALDGCSSPVTSTTPPQQPVHFDYPADWRRAPRRRVAVAVAARSSSSFISHAP